MRKGLPSPPPRHPRAPDPFLELLQSGKGLEDHLEPGCTAGLFIMIRHQPKTSVLQRLLRPPHRLIYLFPLPETWLFVDIHLSLIISFIYLSMPFICLTCLFDAADFFVPTQNANPREPICSHSQSPTHLLPHPFAHSPPPSHSFFHSLTL